MGYGAIAARFQGRLEKLPNKNHDCGAKQQAKSGRSEVRALTRVSENLD
jgi:hypothetical protein